MAERGEGMEPNSKNRRRKIEYPSQAIKKVLDDHLYIIRATTT